MRGGEKINMKKILISLVMITLVGASTVAATRAYFTSQATSSNNTFGAGKLELVLGGVASPVINVNTLEPGKWVYDVTSPYSGTAMLFGSLSVINPGSNPNGLHLKYRFSPQLVSQTVAGFYDLLWIRVYRAEGSSTNFVLKWEGLLKNMMIDPSMVAEMADVAPGSGHDWRFDVGLDSSAGNAYQSASATINFVFEATQVDNPGWTQ